MAVKTEPKPGVRSPDGGRAVTGDAARFTLAVYAAAALSLAAAMIHLWALPEHVLMWWGYGVFFLGVAFFQGLYAVALLRRPARLLCLMGIAANLSIILLYMLTRTTGIPVGPHAGKVEDAGLLDMTATASELGVVLALVILLDGVSRRRTINVLLLLGLALWVLRLAGGLS